MNILIINHYAGSLVHGMEYRHYYLARNFVRNGHRVDIVAASYSHLRSKTPEVRGSISRESIDGIRYWWLKTPAYHGNGIGRVFNMLQFSAMLLAVKRKLVSECSPDLVITSSPHPFAIYGAARIAETACAKLVFEVRDLWPLTLIEIGGVSASHPFVRFMQRAEDYAYRKADVVISLLPKADGYMVSRGMRPEKFIFVPNGIDTHEWESSANPRDDKAHEIIERLRAKGSFIVGYTGAHGIANELGTVINAATLLRSRPVCFVLVGQGPEKDELKKRVADRGLENVIFLPAVPKPSIPDLLKSMDALYIGLKRGPLFRFGISPNKLMDYMMAAKPIIHAIDAGNDMVRESGCGISVPPENPDAVAAAVESLMALPQREREAMGCRGREYVTSRHDYKVLAERILEAVA